ncbi:MAG: hypothetical protein LBI79_08695 [Nitrososphaerota archaeon]|jgi:hypothetical protein|nr:hypothetical protein [Nitrososphaerota archaeon]
MHKNQMQISKKHVILLLCTVAILAVIFTGVLFTFGTGRDGAVVMSIQDVTPNGLSFTIKNTTLKEYTWGESYSLYIFKDDSWEPLEPIIDNGVFISIGYRLAPCAKTDLTSVGWTWLYGELTDGDYKFQKDDLSCEFSIS